jgi:predicted Zn-dependent protease
MARLRWKAYYYDGKTAFRHDADVTISPHAIEVSGKFGAVSWRHEEVRQTQGGHGCEPVRLEKGGEAVIVNEDGFVAALNQIAPRSRFRDASKAGKNILFIIIAFLLTAAAGTGAYFWAIPWAAKIAAEKVPPHVEERLGRTFVEGITRVAHECGSTEVNVPVKVIEERLEAAAPRNPYRFRVYVLKSKTVNAFAAPGGYIVVFTGLIEKTDSPEELAGVLAHEMQHVLNKHATREMFQGYSAGMLASLFLGDFRGTSRALATMGNLRYSRMTEDEADRLGAGLVMKADIDPRGMADVFGKLPEMPNIGFVKYLSDHPATADRVDTIKRLTAGAKKNYVPLLPGIDWKKVRASCD